MHAGKSLSPALVCKLDIRINFYSRKRLICMKLSKIISREWGVFVKLFGVHASEFSRLLHFYGERMKQNYIVKKSYFGQDFPSLPL